jgi:hypothetical protein
MGFALIQWRRGGGGEAHRAPYPTHAILANQPPEPKAPSGKLEGNKIATYFAATPPVTTFAATPWAIEIE